MSSSNQHNRTSSSNQSIDGFDAAKNNANSETSKKSRFPPFDNGLSEDEEVVGKFANTLQNKIDSRAITPTPTERAIIRNAVFFPGFIFGSLATVGTFIFLRRVPILIVNKMQLKRYEYLKENVKHVAAMEGNKPPKPMKEGPVMKTIGTLLDAAFSSLIGIATWSLTINKNKVLNAAADIPLIEGKSEISNHLCSDFIHIYQNEVRPKFWKEKRDDSLKALSRFVQNCEKRQLYEKKLRREMGFIYGDDNLDEIDLPLPVPEEIEDIDDGDDWAALEDVDEDTFDDT
eukprot:CAMPEP_0203676346 /NCGR_PEP_ID=MMETSP0090-20130426/24278_1 /ASSEMBLY_ACC=CAM_ASM_001088 /TAXON_ID=426623 /ORGANISM="Chaetoceros affinis, Strain CCMP159" /LENGTH=287 /DNA_ID=CAMNT_0050542867 /DNA_START=46 /DNA_END=909 /DNA_ORIENTATION=-